MRAQKIKYIVVHTTAGFTNAEGVQNYFLRPKSKGGRGWNTGGYHRIIELDGEVKKMYDWNVVTNGVFGFNDETLHISYVGGLKRTEIKGEYISEDTRTDAQKRAIIECIIEAIMWLKDNGKDITKDLMILGHRDFSDDQNSNGVIESWERIKDCPCFDAIPEYLMYSATNYKQILPKNR